MAQLYGYTLGIMAVGFWIMVFKNFYILLMTTLRFRKHGIPSPGLFHLLCGTYAINGLFKIMEEVFSTDDNGGAPKESNYYVSTLSDTRKGNKCSIPKSRSYIHKRGKSDGSYEELTPIHRIQKDDPWNTLRLKQPMPQSPRVIGTLSGSHLPPIPPIRTHAKLGRTSSVVIPEYPSLKEDLRINEKDIEINKLRRQVEENENARIRELQEKLEQQQQYVTLKENIETGLKESKKTFLPKFSWEKIHPQFVPDWINPFTRKENDCVQGCMNSKEEIATIPLPMEMQALDPNRRFNMNWNPPQSAVGQRELVAINIPAITRQPELFRSASPTAPPGWEMESRASRESLDDTFILEDNVPDRMRENGCTGTIRGALRGTGRTISRTNSLRNCDMASPKMFVSPERRRRNKSTDQFLDESPKNIDFRTHRRGVHRDLSRRNSCQDAIYDQPLLDVRLDRK